MQKVLYFFDDYNC
uniref:Uncharacterized protein n=1 Tax=Anguilla anguilla TaxID=7936 RepID=A0A0E9RVF9_ANGAN